MEYATKSATLLAITASILLLATCGQDTSPTAATGNPGAASASASLQQPTDQPGTAKPSSAAPGADKTVPPAPGKDSGKLDWIIDLASEDLDTRIRAVERLEKEIPGNPRLFLGFIDACSNPAFATAVKERKYKDTFTAAIELLKPQFANMKEYVPELIARLDHPVPMVRAVAAGALSEVGEAALPALPKLAAMLSHESADCRGSAASTLGELGEPAKIHGAKIAALADDPDQEVRRHARRAASSLGAVPGPKVLRAVFERTYSDDEEREDAIRWALEMAGKSGEAGKEFVPLLLTHIRQTGDSAGGSVSLRWAALEAISSLGVIASDAIPDLVGLIKADIDRYSAIRALAAMDRAGYVQLWALRRDDSPEIRAEAMHAIGLSPLVDGPAITMLIAVLGDNQASYEEKRGAVAGLAAAGLKSYPAILDYIVKEGGDGGYMARDVLRNGNLDVWRHLAGIFASQPANIRLVIIDSIGYDFPDDDVKAKLNVSALDDGDMEVQNAAARNVHYFFIEKSKPALPRLLELAGSGWNDLKANALQAIASVDASHRGAAGVAADALDSESESVRMAALTVLRDSAETNASHFPKLAALLARDSMWEERDRLCGALAAIGDPALPLLFGLLEAGDTQTRRGAMDAVFRMLDSSRAATEAAKARPGEPVPAPAHGTRLRILKTDVRQELLSALDDPDTEVRRSVGYSLTTYGPRAIDTMIPAFVGASVDKQAEMLRILGTIAAVADKPDERLVPIFRSAIESGDLRLVEPGHEGISYFPAAAKAMAAEYAKSENIDRRYAGVTIMHDLFMRDVAKHGTEAAEHVMKSLNDDNRAVRVHATERLRRMVHYSLGPVPGDLYKRMVSELEKAEARE